MRRRVSGRFGRGRVRRGRRSMRRRVRNVLRRGGIRL